MKTKPPIDDRPTEDEIREYAHHLYVSSGWLPGRDLDNWLAAEAHLMEEWKRKHPSGKRARHHAAPAESPAEKHAAPAVSAG